MKNRILISTLMLSMSLSVKAFARWDNAIDEVCKTTKAKICPNLYCPTKDDNISNFFINFQSYVLEEVISCIDNPQEFNKKSLGNSFNEYKSKLETLISEGNEVLELENEYYDIYNFIDYHERERFWMDSCNIEPLNGYAVTKEGGDHYLDDTDLSIKVEQYAKVLHAVDKYRNTIDDGIKKCSGAKTELKTRISSFKKTGA